MTIASEITKLNTNLTNSYTACSNKGATLPASQNFDNLASTISAIPAGTTPILASLTVTPSTTAQTITPPSGTDGYNTVIASAVTASIDSDIVAGNIKSGVNILGVTGTYTGSGGGNDVLNKTDVNYAITADNYSVIQARCGSNGNIALGVNYNGGASYTFQTAYSNATYRNTVRAVILRCITLINGSNNSFKQAFKANTAIEYIDLSNLEEIRYGTGDFFQNAFDGTSIKEMRFTKLRLIDATANANFRYAFNGCSNVDIYFNALNSGTFSGGGGYKNTFVQLLRGATGCTVHLPSNLENNTIIDTTYDYMMDDYVSNGTWVTNYTNGFYGTNTTVLFDLPATT